MQIVCVRTAVHTRCIHGGLWHEKVCLMCWLIAGRRDRRLSPVAMAALKACKENDAVVMGPYGVETWRNTKVKASFALGYDSAVNDPGVDKYAS